MKKRFALVLLLLPWYVSFAQQISISVVASSGGYYSSGGYNLTQTIGEMSAIETYSNGNTTITQGFEQGDLLFTSVNNYVSNDVLSAYPNPASDIINVELSGINLRIGQLQLFDGFGKQVIIENNFQIANGNNSVQLNISGLASGVYLLHVQYLNSTSEMFTESKQFYIQK